MLQSLSHPFSCVILFCIYLPSPLLCYLFEVTLARSKAEQLWFQSTAFRYCLCTLQLLFWTSLKTRCFQNQIDCISYSVRI